MRWPGADAKVVEFPGPDAHEVRFPGPDRRGVMWPPAPTFAIVLVAEAFGVGSATATVSAVSLPVAAASGTGVGSASVATALEIDAPAAGSGAAAAAYLPSEVDAAAVGTGTASAAMLPRVAVTASAAGAGAASATVQHAAIVSASAVGSGIAAASTTARVAVAAAAAGSGAASATVLTGYRFSDNFNRADDASLGANWRVDRNGSPRISTNRAQMKTMSGGGRQGCWASWQAGTFATDNYSVEAQFIAPIGNLASDNMTGIILAVADTFGAATMCYCVMTTANGCAIYTQVGLPPTTGISTGQTGQTQRAVTATNASTSDLFRFQRVGNVFTLYRNGAVFLTWTDTGNLVASGATNRRWGMFFEGNTVVFPAADYRSPAIDTITEARDL